MAKPPMIMFYTDPECKTPLDEKTVYGPCQAGEVQVYNVWAHNEGELAYEQYEIRAHGFYQVPRENGHFLQATEHLQLLRTPRPHRLEPGMKAHIRLEWRPPEDCEHPLIFTLEIEGDYVISPEP